MVCSVLPCRTYTDNIGERDFFSKRKLIFYTLQEMLLVTTIVHKNLLQKIESSLQRKENIHWEVY